MYACVHVCVGISTIYLNIKAVIKKILCRDFAVQRLKQISSACYSLYIENPQTNTYTHTTHKTIKISGHSSITWLLAVRIYHMYICMLVHYEVTFKYGNVVVVVLVVNIAAAAAFDHKKMDKLLLVTPLHTAVTVARTNVTVCLNKVCMYTCVYGCMRMC